MAGKGYDRWRERVFSLSSGSNVRDINKQEFDLSMECRTQTLEYAKPEHSEFERNENLNEYLNTVTRDQQINFKCR